MTEERVPTTRNWVFLAKTDESDIRGRREAIDAMIRQMGGDPEDSPWPDELKLPEDDDT
jgi:hypothetical protein